MAFNMKGFTPFTKSDGWWDKIKRQFSSKNPHGFGDYRGRKKRLTNAQLKHRQKHPRRRGESMTNYRKRIKE